MDKGIESQMNQMLFNQFGFNPGMYIYDLAESKKLNQKKIQSESNDFSNSQFVCPVSKKSYNNKYEHNSDCIYKYCRGGWDFNRKPKYKRM